MVKRWGSLPSRRMISGRIRRLALINQLQTCRLVSPASLARDIFSASLGYALYRWSYSHFFNTLMESLGRFPLRLRGIPRRGTSSELEWSSVLELGYRSRSPYIALRRVVATESHATSPVKTKILLRRKRFSLLTPHNCTIVNHPRCYKNHYVCVYSLYAHHWLVSWCLLLFTYYDIYRA